MTTHVAVIEYPSPRLFIWDSEKILATEDAAWFDKRYGARHVLRDLARRRSLPRYAALAFTNGMGAAPLASDADGNLELNGATLYQLLWNTAARRAGTHTVIDPADVDRWFERHSPASANAYSWTVHVLPYLMAGTPPGRLPNGTSQYLTVETEHARHGALWAEAAQLFDGPA